MFSKEEKYIVKSNALVEARYRLGIQEIHVVFWLLQQIRPEDEDFKPHKLKISEFSEMVGVRPEGQYKELRNVTKRLIQRAMEIYEPEKKEHVQVSWLSSARYQHTKGYVVLEFSPHLKPYLLQLKSHFTRIEAADILELRSVYSVRIFELLLQYETIGKRHMSIEEFRNYCGIDIKKYGLYADLKRFAIERAKIEINTKTEYEVHYTEIKEGRKVIALEWTIKKKTHFEKSQEEKARIIQKELRSGNVIIQELLEYGFTLPHSRRLVKSNDHETLVNAIKSVDIQVERGRAKNPKAMLVKAIQEKWHPEKFVDRKPKAS